MTEIGRRRLRFIAVLRYPLVLVLLVTWWVLSDGRMNQIAADLESGLADQSRLDEVLAFESELSQFYIAARKLAYGDPATWGATVHKKFDLVFARITTLNSSDYAAFADASPDGELFEVLASKVVAFRNASRRLVKGEPASYQSIQDLEFSLSKRITGIADWASAERRALTSAAAVRDASTRERLREIGLENLLVLGGALLYVIAELTLYWASNRKLARLVAAKRRAMRTDYLTGIANRMSFEETLAACINEPNVNVIYFDLDGFKKVNDWLGHDIGDELLKSVAEILQRHRGPSDVVARFGGDEFAALVRDGKPEVLAQAVVEEIAKGFDIEDNAVSVTASAGICARSAFGQHAAVWEMMRNADLALYAAKRRGKNQVVHFSADLLEKDNRKLALEADIEAAIRSAAIEVAFQPIVEIASGKVSGIEALVRWDHPNLGQIPAVEACETARNAGQLITLTLHVFETSCRFLSNAAFLGNEFRVAVNIAPDLLSRPEFPALLLELSKKWSIAPRQFVLEVTEQSAELDSGQVERSLSALHGYGFILAIDDFGTGQSNLVRLSDMDFTVLKLDKSLIDHVETSSKGAQIVGALSRLGADIAIETVAEGVETKGQLDVLRALGVTYAQGYLISEPLSPAATLHFLIAGRDAPAVGTNLAALRPAVA